MYKEFEVLKNIIKEDYSYVEHSNNCHLCFCTNDLLGEKKLSDSMQKDTFRNMFFHFCGNDYFYATIYACFENGEIKKDECPATLTKKEILNWALDFVAKARSETRTGLSAIYICLTHINPYDELMCFSVYKA